MPSMALGTTTIENIVAHDAAALEKDLASIRLDSQLTLPGVPQIVTRLQQMLGDPDVGIPQLIPVINYEPILVGRVQRSLVQYFDPKHMHLAEKIPGIQAMRDKFK